MPLLFHGIKFLKKMRPGSLKVHLMPWAFGREADEIFSRKTDDGDYVCSKKLLDGQLTAKLSLYPKRCIHLYE